MQKKLPKNIKEAHELLVKGDLKVKELVQTCLDNIEDRKNLNAFIEVYDDVIEQAELAQKKIDSGDAVLLTGIPIAVKDNILIKRRKVSAGSKILEGYKATYDATVIAKLKDAGVVFIGRTNMDEFAMGASTETSAFGITKNPHDPERVPGGSSGGSAVAVAGGMCMVALGSDTAGSIRQPSAFCGVVGLKPTYGAVSRNGLIALGSSLDVIGVIAKNIEDAQIVFNLIKGKDKMDSTTIDSKDNPLHHPMSERSFLEEEVHQLVDDGKGATLIKTIGVPKFIKNMNDINDVVRKNFKENIEKLKKLGYKIKEIDLPHLKYAVPAYYIILPAEASANLARFDGVRYGLHKDGEDGIDDYFKTKGIGFGKEVRRRIIIGTHVLSAGYHDAYYNKAQAVRELIREDFEKAFKEIDAVITPTTAGSAFKIGEKINNPVRMYLEDIFTVSANHAGLPAISIPSNRNKQGDFKEETLPLGLQIIAPHMKEEILFDISKKFLGEN